MITVRALVNLREALEEAFMLAFEIAYRPLDDVGNRTRIHLKTLRHL